MTKSYSNDLRKRVIEYLDSGRNYKEASKLFKARVGKFINRKKENKKYYKDTVKNTFGIHELIMYKENNLSDLLSPT